MNGGEASLRRLGSWEDLYRRRWAWDRVAKGSHGWLNCRSACNWDLFVKDGVVVREEQTGNYEASEPGLWRAKSSSSRTVAAAASNRERR